MAKQRRRWYDRVTQRDAQYVKANNFVGLAMSRFKRHRLSVGGLSQKVRSRAQAVAIGLSMQERYGSTRKAVKPVPAERKRSGQDSCIDPGYWSNQRRLGGV